MENKITAKHASYMFLFVYILGIIFRVVKSSFFPYLNSATPPVVGFLGMVLIAQMGIYVLPSVAFSLYMGADLKKVYKLNRVYPKQLALCIALFTLSQVTILFLHNLMDVFAVVLGLKYEMSVYPTARSLSELVILVIAIGLIPPLCEDLLFRGFMLTGGEKNGPIFGIVFTAFSFAIWHDNPFRILELFYYALIAGLIVYYTNSIWTGIIIHVITNASYVVVSYYLQADMIMNSKIDAGTDVVNQYGMMRLLGIGMFGGIAFALSLLIIKKLKNMWEQETVTAATEPGNYKMYRSIGLPMVVIIALFVFQIVFLKQ